MLLSVELQDRPKGHANLHDGKTQTPPIKKALILAFRGTEALKNANVSPSPKGSPLEFLSNHLLHGQEDCIQNPAAVTLFCIPSAYTSFPCIHGTGKLVITDETVMQLICPHDPFSRRMFLTCHEIPMSRPHTSAPTALARSESHNTTPG